MRRRVVMSLKIPKPPKSRPALSGFHLCPNRLKRCGKGGIRAKTLVLVWTLAAWEFRHHATTRRRKPPDVCFSGQPLGGVSAFGRNFLKRLRAFFGTLCLSCACSLKIVNLGRNWAFFAGVRFARRGRLLFSVVILLYSCCYLVVFKLFLCCLYE